MEADAGHRRGGAMAEAETGLGRGVRGAAEAEALSRQGKGGRGGETGRRLVHSHWISSVFKIRANLFLSHWCIRSRLLCVAPPVFRLMLVAGRGVCQDSWAGGPFVSLRVVFPPRIHFAHFPFLFSRRSSRGSREQEGRETSLE